MSILSKKYAQLRFKVSREVSPYLARWRFGTRLLPVMKRVKGSFHYSIIITAHNVEAYFDELMESLIEQSLDFENNLFLIIVDDGSTDQTSLKIQSWAQKYPNNITTLYQERSGISMARNQALAHIKTPWVTFIDGDDFLDLHYFKNADKVLEDNPEAALISCYSVNYDEKLKRNKRYIDEHPLREKFKAGVQAIEALSDDFFIPYVTSTFFKTDFIKSKNLSFQKESIINFSDVDFIGNYLLSVKGQSLIINPRSVYFSRVRKKESLQATQKTIIDFGHSIVPKTIQRMILYTVMDYLVAETKNPQVKEVEKQSLEESLHNILSLVDVELMRNFIFPGLSNSLRLGILGRYKGFKFENFEVQVDQYDYDNESVRLSYECYFDENDSFLVNGKLRSPLFTKKAVTLFNNEKIFYKKLVWIELSPNEELSVRINGKDILEVTGASVQKKFQPIKCASDNAYKGAWLFIDRDTQADDNAEHFYRYVMNAHPEILAYFVLRKNSHDWPRLEKEGFKLLDMNSKEYKEAFKGCAKILSSHADTYVTHFLGKNSLNGKQYVFLQHGVTMNNISRWLNKKKIDCFVCSTTPEFLSIVSDDSPFVFGRKEAVLTGFPRHDRLIRESKKREAEKILLIMPTWRMYISGNNIGQSNNRTYNKNFKYSHYARAWKGLLNSSELKKLADNFGYKILFFPHANTQIYLKDLEVPSYVQVVTHENYRIQDIFLKSKIMITDYSSVSFEMAIQKKPVIYFQFDEEEFFSGIHHYKRGYFDYRRDGFGPVCLTEEELTSSLNVILENNGEMTSEYARRVQETFPFFDDKNCERLFNHLSGSNDRRS